MDDQIDCLSMKGIRLADVAQRSLSFLRRARHQRPQCFRRTLGVSALLVFA